MVSRSSPLSRSSRSPSRPSRSSGKPPGIATLLVFASACAASCHSEAPPAPRVETASEARIERKVVAAGTIEPSREVEIRSRIAGIVKKVHVSRGEPVAAGAPLVEIERELLEARLMEAEANVDAAAVALRFARVALDRTIELHETGSSSDQIRDDATARFEKAQAERARVGAVAKVLSTQLSYSTVRASMDGRVLVAHVEEGSAVSPVTSANGGTLLLTLSGDRALHLEGLVDEHEIVRVQVGQPARVRVEAHGDRVFEGRVREIAPVGQRLQNVTYFEVEIEITDPEVDSLRPRMSGEAEIITEVVDSAVVVPELALRYEGDQTFVELATGAGADSLAPRGGSLPPERRSVEIGIVDRDRVQILSGLAPGERVVLD